MLSLRAVTTDWTPSGFVPEVLVRQSPDGPVWRAREVASGNTVELHQAGSAGSPERLDAVRDRVRALAAVRCAHLAVPRAVVDGPRGPVLVVDHVPGTRRLSRPGTLDSRAAQGLVAALVALHAAGLVHAGPTAQDVRLDEDGSPVLGGLAALPAVDRVARQDVVWLGELCGLAPAALVGVGAAEDLLSLLRGGPAAPPAAPLAAALAAAPAARPTALSTAPPTAPPAARLAVPSPPAWRTGPVRASPHTGPRPQRRGRWQRGRRLRRGILVGAASLAGLGAASASWLLALATLVPGWGRTGVMPAGTVVGGPWRVVLDRLEAARRAAFLTGDVRLLDRVYVAGCPAALADRAALTARAVRPGTAAAASLARPTQLLVTPAGHGGSARSGAWVRLVLGEVSAGRARSVTLVLVGGPRGWRIRSIGPGPST